MRAWQPPNGRHRAKSQSEPTLSMQDTPTNLPPMFRLPRRRMAPEHLSDWPVDWFKRLRMIANLATPINQIPSTPLANSTRLGVIGFVVSELGREAARYRNCRLELPSRPEILQASLTTIPAGARDGHHGLSLGFGQPWEARADRVGHVIRREMRIMALRHPGIGMAELPGNDRHGHGLHGEDRRMGVPQHMESDLRDDASAHTGFANRPQLFGALPAASVIALEQHVSEGRPQIKR